MIGLWIGLGVIAVIALALVGLEISIRLTRKKNSRFDSQELKVVDTIGRNDDGTKRQDILRGIAAKTGEYKKLGYELRQYMDKNNENGFGVYVNGRQIGSIAREDVPTLLSVWDRIERIFYVNAFPIKGGKNYGATVILKLKKQA